MAASMENLSTNVSDNLNDIYGLLESKDPVLFVGIAAAILVIIITILLLACRGVSSSKKGILIVGLCESGKTLLFSKLVYEKYVPTQTSIKENAATYFVPSDKKPTVKLVDLPGHDRLRLQLLDQHKATARGIIFVIDSFAFQKELKDVAEFLYTVLTDRTIARTTLPILIACNKQDYTLAKGANVIQSALEKELNKVRVTRSAALSSLDGNKNAAVTLGRANHDFAFADVRPIRIEFAECSAKGTDKGDVDLKQVVAWLAKVA